MKQLPAAGRHCGPNLSRVRRARRMVAVVGVVVATFAFASPSLASAAPTPTPTPASTTQPGTGGSQPSTADTGTRVWGVRPASAAGQPDARTHFTLQSNPGSTLTDQALVTNLSDTTTTFSVYGTDAFNTATGQFDLLAADRKPSDLGSWMTFDNPTVTVPARGSVVVPFWVVVPATATPGDHAAGFVVSLITLGAGGTQNVNVDSRVAVRVYLRIPGNLKPRLEVGPVTASYTGVGNPFGGGSVAVTYTVTNTGNIRLRAKQNITVAGLFGWKVGNSTPADLPEILPGQSATFQSTLEDVFPAGPLTVSVNEAPYPDPEQPVGQSIAPVTGSTTVWSVPWLLLILLVVVILGGASVWWWRRRRHLSRLDSAMIAAREETLQEVRTGGLA